MRLLPAGVVAAVALMVASPSLAAVGYITSSNLPNDTTASANTLASPALTVAVPPGSLVVVGCGERGTSGDVGTPTDSSGGNTYTATGTEFDTNSSMGFRVWQSLTAANLPIGATISCNYLTTSTAHKYIRAASFSGMAAAPFDARVTGTAASGNPNVTTGTLNYAAGGTQMVVVAFTAYNGFPAYTPNGAWVDLGSPSSLDLQYLIVNSPTTTALFNPVMSPNSAGSDTLLQSFKGAASGVSAPVCKRGFGLLSPC